MLCLSGTRATDLQALLQDVCILLKPEEMSVFETILRGVLISQRAFARHLVIFGVRPIKGHMYLSDLGISRGIRYLLFEVVPNAFVNYRKHVSSD